MNQKHNKKIAQFKLFRGLNCAIGHENKLFKKHKTTE